MHQFLAWQLVDYIFKMNHFVPVPCRDQTVSDWPPVPVWTAHQPEPGCYEPRKYQNPSQSICKLMASFLNHLNMATFEHDHFLNSKYFSMINLCCLTSWSFSMYWSIFLTCSALVFLSASKVFCRCSFSSVCSSKRLWRSKFLED